jgi:hypothetical protein
MPLMRQLTNTKTLALLASAAVVVLVLSVTSQEVAARFGGGGFRGVGSAAFAAADFMDLVEEASADRASAMAGHSIAFETLDSAVTDLAVFATPAALLIGVMRFDQAIPSLMATQDHCSKTELTRQIHCSRTASMK